MRTEPDASPGPAAAAGVAGGVGGTLLMSAVMLVAGRLGLMGRQPPRQIVDEAADESDAGRHADDPARDAMASVLHLAIGAGSGLVLVALRRVARAVLGRALPAPVAGALFGLGLWAVNYLALAPALDLLPPPSRDRPTRPPVMIAAHLVFGVTSAVVAAWLEGVVRAGTGPVRPVRRQLTGGSW